MSMAFGALAHLPSSDEPTGVRYSFALDAELSPPLDDRLSDGLECLIAWAIADAEFRAELLRDAVAAAHRRGGSFSARELAVLASGGAADVGELAELWLARWCEQEHPASGAPAVRIHRELLPVTRYCAVGA